MTQAEELVIGRLLVEPTLLKHATINESYFTANRNRAVFLAVREVQPLLVDGDDMHNLHQVGAQLERAGHYDNVGGLARLTEYYPATGETFYHHLKVLKQAFLRRRMKALLAEAIDRLGQEETEDVIDYLLPKFNSFAGTSTDSTTLLDNVRDEAKDIFEHIEATEAGNPPLVGIPTGIQNVDDIIGGLPIGVPSIIAARPGEGKSTVALNIANSCANRGLGVHLFSYEDGEKSFAQRMLSLRTNTNLAKIVHRKLNANERARLQKMKTGALNRIRIERAHGYSAKQIGRSYRTHKRELKTSLVIVDYLQLMPGPDKKQPTHEQLDANMRELAALAAMENCAVLVLSQLRREAQNVEPKLNDLAKSSSIEQIGKLIIALYADNPKSTELKFIILKNFQGSRGYTFAHYNRAECLIK